MLDYPLSEKDNFMALAPTYYDFILRLRPYIVELAEQDAHYLLSGENPPQVIVSSDEFDSCLPEVFKRTDEDFIAMVAKHQGVTHSVVEHQLLAYQQAFKAEVSALYMTANMEYHCMLNFALSGKRTFTFSDNLSDHLANTALNVKADMIRLPFPSCQFQFTSPAFINALYNLKGDAGRKMMNQNAIDYSAPVSVFLTMLPAAPLKGEKLIMCAFHARQPDKCYMATKREIYLGEDWSLEQSLRTDWETLTPDNLGIGMNVDLEGESVAQEGSEVFYTDGFAFFRAVLNAVLYNGSEHAELIPQRSRRAELLDVASTIISAPKRKKKLQEAARYSILDATSVGDSVRPIQIAKGIEPSKGGSPSNAKTSIRIMVRGHWKTQHYGEGKAEQKLIRIEPYYRGPEMADLVTKPYRVK